MPTSRKSSRQEPFVRLPVGPGAGIPEACLHSQQHHHHFSSPFRGPDTVLNTACLSHTCQPHCTDAETGPGSERPVTCSHTANKRSHRDSNPRPLCLLPSPAFPSQVLPGTRGLWSLLPNGSDSVRDLGHVICVPRACWALVHSSVKGRGAFLSGLLRVEPEAR